MLEKKDWQRAVLSVNSKVKDSIYNLECSKMQIVLVVDDNKKLVGTITDGDIRRGIEKNYDNFFDQPAELIMSKDPKTIESKTLAISALEITEKHSITSLFVFSDKTLKKPDGIIHIHDILKSGIK